MVNAVHTFALPRVLGRKIVTRAQRAAGILPPRCALDAVYCVGNRFISVGWHEDAQLTLTHRAGGHNVNTELHRFHRPDLVEMLGADNRSGFVAIGTSTSPLRPMTSVVTALHGAGGRTTRDSRIPDEPNHGHVLDVAHRLLADGTLTTQAVVDSLVGPSLRGTIDHRRSLPFTSTVGYSSPAFPSQSLANVVVPFYGSMECARSIMASLSQLNDAHLGGALAVTFVCDDPRLAGSFIPFVTAQNEFVNELPLRVLVHSHNRGFATACNTGSDAVDSEVTVFLNSDVIAPGHDTLVRLCRTLLEDSSIAAASPTLHFADGTVQARQLELYEDADFPGFHLLRPPHRGQPPRSDWPSIEDVALLPGAMLAVRTDTFRAVGRFSDAFGSGDFEDAELCIRLGQRGRLVVISAPAVHLEAMSYKRNTLDVLARARILNDRAPS